MSIGIAVGETVVADVEHRRPVTIPTKLGNGAHRNLLSTLAELDSRREKRARGEFAKVFGSAVCPNNVVEQENLFFRLHTPRRGFARCLVRVCLSLEEEPVISIGMDQIAF